jgi:hypothetical protein
MGKRGPQPKGPYPDKAEVFSTRIRADTKRALIDAAKESGHTLSQEAEHRLRASFGLYGDRKFIEALGGERIAALLRAISVALLEAGRRAHAKPHEVLHDPLAYDAAVKAIVLMLEAFRPPGELVYSKGEPDWIGAIAEKAAREAAMQWLSLIADQPPGQPIPSDRLDAAADLARRIGDGLKELRSRAEQFVRAEQKAQPRKQRSGAKP